MPEAVYEMNPNTYRKTMTIMSGQMTTTSNFSSLLKGLSSPSLVVSFSCFLRRNLALRVRNVPKRKKAPRRVPIISMVRAKGLEPSRAEAH